MSAAEMGHIVPSLVETNSTQDVLLIEIGQELYAPTQTIINYLQYIVSVSEQDEELQDFSGDLDKMLVAGEQLSSLIHKVFAQCNFPNGEIDLSAFGSTIRHDLRTPINAFIGYSEMILEDVSQSDFPIVYDNLQHIIQLARRLLTLIDDLSRLTQDQQPPLKEVTETTSNLLSQSPIIVEQSTTAFNYSTTLNDDSLIAIGESLRVPTTNIIDYVKNILAQTKQYDDLENFAPDLEKMLRSGNQLFTLVTKLFFDREAQTVDLESFSSTIRHDLRTPINAFIGYSEMLLEDIEIDVHPEACGHLQQILSLSRRLLSIISDLSHLSKSDSNTKVDTAPQLPKLPEAATLVGPNQTTKTPEPISEEQQEFINAIQTSSLLVVDDKESNRELLSRRLDKQGFNVDTAENGKQALEMVYQNDYDLILLDIIMPEVDGFQVLAQMKKDPKLRHIPIIMISALDEIDGVVRCIDMGAEDYLQKPFNQVILKAKINASLERKRFRDKEQAYLRTLKAEQEKSEKLLLNILPKPIADRLKIHKETIADDFDEVTVLFADLVKFTQMSAGISARALVDKLNEIFFAFDILTEVHGLEKIKTIGDAYMLVGGVPTQRPDHAEAVADIAIAMFKAIERINHQNASQLQIRIGIHTGPVVAGVIGKNKFNYDLWGDAVNVASRMESQGIPGKIQVSEATYHLLKKDFSLEKRGEVDIKGKGQMTTYFLNKRIMPK